MESNFLTKQHPGDRIEISWNQVFFPVNINISFKNSLIKSEGEFRREWKWTCCHIWYLDPIKFEVIVPKKLSSELQNIPLEFWAIMNSDRPFLFLIWRATASLRSCLPWPSCLSKEQSCLFLVVCYFQVY